MIPNGTVLLLYIVYLVRNIYTNGIFNINIIPFILINMKIKKEIKNNKFRLYAKKFQYFLLNLFYYLVLYFFLYI
jgi:hypothetical protein